MAATHDYSKRRAGIGWAFVILGLEDAGKKLRVLGFDDGQKVEAGDYLILPDGEGGTTRYRVEVVTYLEETDVWKGTLIFDPR
jgi:hypothetical protein